MHLEVTPIVLCEFLPELVPATLDSLSSPNLHFLKIYPSLLSSEKNKKYHN